jgi:hypothetical protein
MGAGFRRGIRGLYLSYLWMFMLFLALVMVFWVRIWLLGSKVVTIITKMRQGAQKGVFFTFLYRSSLSILR